MYTMYTLIQILDRFKMTLSGYNISKKNIVSQIAAVKK